MNKPCSPAIWILVASLQWLLRQLGRSVAMLW